MDSVNLQTSNADSRSATVENGPKDTGTANQTSFNGSFGLELAEDLSKSADRNKEITPPPNNVEASIESDMGDIVGTQNEGHHIDSNQSPEKVNSDGENEEGMVKQKSKKKIYAVKEKSSEIHLEKNKSPKQGNRRSTRRSLKTSFKDILKSIEDKITAEGTDVALSGLKAVKVEDNALEDEIIQSSYTPLHSSEAEKPLPFEFSSASIFSKAARSFAAGSFADSESSVSNVEDADKDSITMQANLNENVEVAANEDAVISHGSSTSPDFIPSSQSQRDATPILKGVTMANPRRSFRRVKKTERLLEAESSNAIKMSLAKLSQTVLCKMGNMRKKQGEDMEEEQNSLERLGVIQEEEQVNVECHEHQGEVVAEETVADVATEEAGERDPTANEDNMTSKEKLLNGFLVVPYKSAKDTDSMFDNEMDSALLEKDLERVSEKEEPTKDNEKNTSYEELGEHVPQKRRSRKQVKKRKSIRESDNTLVTEADNDENMNSKSGNLQIGGGDDEVNYSIEHTVSKKSGRKSRRKNKADIEHNKANIEHNKVERSDVGKRGRTKGSKASKIDKFSNEGSGHGEVLTRRSTRSTKLNEQTKALAVEASDSAGQKESAAANELDVKDCILPRKSCTGDTIKLCQFNNARSEDCPIELASDSNGEDSADAAEAPPASPANVKRKRKSRKSVADRDKRSSLCKGTVQLVAGLSISREVEESEENNRAKHAVSSKEGSVCEKVQDDASAISLDLAMDENNVTLQKNVTDTPRKQDDISGAAQGNVERVFAQDKVEESHEATVGSTQSIAVKTSDREISARSKLVSSELECVTQLPLIDKVSANDHLKEDPVPVVNCNEKSKAKRRTPRKVGSKKRRNPKARLLRTDLSAKSDFDKNNVSNSGTMNVPSKAEVGGGDESENSSEDSLTLSEISTRAAKEQHGFTCCDQDAERNSYAAKENQLGTLVCQIEDNQMAGNSTESDAGILRKKELGNVPSNIASETIENIFNSPDSSEELGNQLLPQRDTFLIVKRTSIKESDITTIGKEAIERMKKDTSSKTGDSLIPSEEHKDSVQNVDDFQRGGPSSNLRNYKNLADSRVSETSHESIESQHVSMASRSSAFVDSPLGKRKGIGEFSPRSGILKRRVAEKPDTPSPPNKVFYVSSLQIVYFLLLLKNNTLLTDVSN